MGKIIGAGLGFAVMGPLGGLLGLAIGAGFDRRSADTKRWSDFEVKPGQAYTAAAGDARRRSYTKGDFAVSLVVLFAAVAKADRKVTQDEYNYIRNYFSGKFGHNDAADLMRIFEGVIHQYIDHRGIAGQVKDYIDYYSRLQLLQMLYGLAKADGKIDAVESNVLNQIAYDLGIDSRDQVSLRAVYFKEDNGDYKTLGISPDATPEEVKKAYRTLVAKYHPDKVSHLGPEFAEIAEEKFIAVKEAYDHIRAERGF